MEAVTKDTAPAAARGRIAKRAYVILAALAAIVAVVWLVHRWWTHGKESTDDAQVEADVVPIAARVGGTIAVARVHDNQSVKRGDTLFELDPASLDVEVARGAADLLAAQAQLAVARAQVAIVRSSSSGGLSSARAALTGASATVRGAADTIRAAEAAVARAGSDLRSAQDDLDRAQALLDKGAITRHDFDQAVHARDVAKAGHEAATAQLGAARAMRGSAQARVGEAEARVTQSAPVDQQIAAAEAAADLAGARVKAAEAMLARAKLDREHATVIAPSDGVVSRLAAHVGQSINLGQTLLMLVPNDSYVVANFKEGQIAHMRPGDRVDIDLDAYGGHFTGVIDTISPATGSRFSLIPPDNATGNFVKVVQRVPVKITWREAPKLALRPGLSAEVTVHVAD